MFQLALRLNDAENYRTDEEYENHLITKIASFQCVSAFGTLFYISFYRRDMHRLQETLATLLITRQLTQNIMELAVPFIAEKLRLCRLTYKLTRSISDETLRKQVAAVRKRRDTEAEEAILLRRNELPRVETGEGECDDGVVERLKGLWGQKGGKGGVRLRRSDSRWTGTRLRCTNVSDMSVQLLNVSSEMIAFAQGYEITASEALLYHAQPLTSLPQDPSLLPPPARA